MKHNNLVKVVVKCTGSGHREVDPGEMETQVWRNWRIFMDLLRNSDRCMKKLFCITFERLDCACVCLRVFVLVL